MNPLEIPVVVKVVVSYINEFEDLKSFRRLHTSWRKETLEKWRNSAVFLITDETFPLLVKAYSEQNWEDLSNEEKINIDPFEFRQVPFKKYRFSKELTWTYPLEDTDLDKKLICEKVIQPNATYLDVGECTMKWKCFPKTDRNSGLYWVIGHCPNVVDLEMTPFTTEWDTEGESDSSEHIFQNFRLVSVTIFSPAPWRQLANEGKAVPLFNMHRRYMARFCDYFRGFTSKFKLRLVDTANNRKQEFIVRGQRYEYV